MPFGHIKTNRIGIDIGGSLSKLVFYAPEELKIDLTDSESHECIKGDE